MICMYAQHTTDSNVIRARADARKIMFVGFLGEGTTSGRAVWADMNIERATRPRS